MYRSKGFFDWYANWKEIRPQFKVKTYVFMFLEIISKERLLTISDSHGRMWKLKYYCNSNDNL